MSTADLFTIIFPMLAMTGGSMTFMYYAIIGNITDLKRDLKEDIGALDSKITALRTELKGDIGALKTELKGDIGALKTELKGDIGALRTELKGDIGALDSKVTTLSAEIKNNGNEISEMRGFLIASNIIPGGAKALGKALGSKKYTGKSTIGQVKENTHTALKKK